MSYGRHNLEVCLGFLSAKNRPRESLFVYPRACYRFLSRSMEKGVLILANHIGFNKPSESPVDPEKSATGGQVEGQPGGGGGSGGRVDAPKRVCMITHSFYESDSRVLRYAEALAQRGDSVDVLALRRSPDIPKEEVIFGVKVFRIQDRFGKTEKSKSSFLWPLLRFLAVASWWVMNRHRGQRYDLLHVHNIPDFLVFAAWYPKLTGTPVILDIHDIVPEFFGSKFGASKHATMVWALKLIEKVSAAFADHVIIANHLWLERYTSRAAPLEKCSVFINHVDARIFQSHQSGEGAWRPVVLFPGGLEWHQGLDIAIRAFKRLLLRIPNAEFHIYGDVIMKPQLIELVRDLGLTGSVQFFDPLPIREIANVMSKAGLGVVPKRANSFGNEASSTKIMEFMSLGVPVVVSNTKVERFYLNDSLVRFFESGNDEQLAEAMFDLFTDQQLRRRLVERSFEYVSRNSWQNSKFAYFRLIDATCARR
jgi:glycosyltransferase involved in cell wall biosynthesis